MLSFAFLPLEANRPIAAGLAVAVPVGARGPRARAPADVRLGAQPLLAVTDPQQRDPQKIIREDDNGTRALRSMFDDTVGGASEQLFLLNVSTNVDQFGVCIGSGRRLPTVPNGLAFPIPAQIEALDLVTEGRNIRLFTMPQIQWEPVRTPVQNLAVGPFPFPSPLFSGDDGGPTRLGVDTVELVPIAPRPVLEQIVTAFNRDEDNRPVGALFTLPFGMKAMARLLLPGDRGEPGAFLILNQPRFAIPLQPLEGGLQLKVAAYSPDAGPNVKSPTLSGATIQLRNGQDDFGDMLLKSALDDNVDSIFNGEFAPATADPRVPGGANPRVPITRIDFSGYGSSLFSNWVNPSAVPPATIQVRFDVIVGRTAYEVVKVKSLLYCACPAPAVVRTIIIQRTGSGGVVRHDSGWASVTPGLYQVKGLTFHPGVVKGMFNIREIRETGLVYTDGSVEMRAVHFDADILIENVVRGASASSGLVATRGQFGFVQTGPVSDDRSEPQVLTPAQFDKLLQRHGPLGGPVDCMINVGGSELMTRTTRVDISSARTSGGQIEFASACRVSPVLSKDGQWSMVRKPANVGLEAQALGRDSGVPLVREGIAGLDDASNANPYRFADPADLLQPDQAPADYGWLWSTGTQRILFARPKIAKGAKAITSDRKPLLANSFAIINSAGVFPSALSCLEIPFSNYSLEIAGEGGLRLVLPSSDFAAVRVAGGVERDLGNSATTRFYVDYTNTRIILSLDSTSVQSWSYEQNGLAIVNESDGARVKTSRGSIFANSSVAPRFILLSEEFGEALDQAKPIMPLFSSSSLAGLIPSGGATVPFDASAAKEATVKAGIKVGIGIPENLPLIIGTTLGGGFIELTTNLHSFFSLEVVAPILVMEVFHGSVRFKYEAEALKQPLPGSSFNVASGTKKSLILAVGAFAEGDFPLSVFQLNFKVFFGLGFIHENKPGEKSVSVAAFFSAQGSVEFPIGPITLAEAGLKVEGQGTIRSEGGDQVLELKGKIAFELTVALFLDIEFSTDDTTVANIIL